MAHEIDALPITLAEPTSVDRMLEEYSDSIRKLLNPSRDRMLHEARKVLAILQGFDANLGDFDGNLPPVIVIRLTARGIVYLITLEPQFVLTGVYSSRIVEGLIPYLEKLKEAKLKPVMIFYSKKGKLTLAGYLYLGHVIDDHQVGILFVNGDYDEVAEIVWSLENKGTYEVDDESPVDLKGMEK